MPQATEKNKATHSLYAVLNENDTYFAGFNVEKGAADFVESPLEAKLFGNKHEIKLRPNEHVVEITFTLTEENSDVSEPFRPRRREVKPR
jgi:hypothetical protein